MGVSNAQFRAWIVEAIHDIEEAGKTLEEVLAERELTSLDVARAIGFLEGAAAALNATVLELLWNMGFDTETDGVPR